MSYNKRFRSKIESSLYLDRKFYQDIIDYIGGVEIADGGVPSTPEIQYLTTLDGGFSSSLEQDYDQIYDGGTV
jgi:hypothetical protein